MYTILEGVEGLPPTGTPEYWTYHESLKYLIGLASKPIDYTGEIGQAICVAVDAWRKKLKEN